jgi:hypothetical protein
MALHQLIARVYNAHQHRVLTIHGDCESVNLSLIPSLGSIGCTLIASPPADHAQRAERYTQTFLHVCIAMLASLPYYLPKTYILNLLQAGAASRNSLVSAKTSPYTPNDLVLHSSPPSFPFPFGSCCMVLSPKDKRVKFAQDSETLEKLAPKMELGVCMGPDTVTGETFFLLENGFIVPRKPGDIMAPTVPVDWKPKQIISTAVPLYPPLSPPDSSNSAIQFPNAPAVPLPSAITDPFIPPSLSPLVPTMGPSDPPPSLPHTPFPPGLSLLC